MDYTLQQATCLCKFSMRGAKKILLLAERDFQFNCSYFCLLTMNIVYMY